MSWDQLFFPLRTKGKERKTKPERNRKKERKKEREKKREKRKKGEKKRENEKERKKERRRERMIHTVVERTSRDFHDPPTFSEM